MQIRAIDTSICRERRRFVHFPFALYYQTPQWVPQIVSSMALVLDREKHPFYQHSDAQFFVAEENGQVVGRLAVLHHKPYSEYHHEATAFFTISNPLTIKRSPTAFSRTPKNGPASRGARSCTAQGGFCGLIVPAN